MNSISYITHKVEGALHPSDLDPIIPKVPTASPPPLVSHGDDSEATQLKNKEDSGLPYILHIILYVPNILIFRPLLFCWFVITFPLSLLEKRSSTTNYTATESKQEAEEAEEEKSTRPSLERTSTGTIPELDEDVDKLETDQQTQPPDDDTESDIKSPTSPSTSSILAHNSKLFTFPRTLYPVNLTNTNFKKTLILDLDETLVHSVSRGTRLASSAYQVEIRLKNQVPTLYYVQKRPYCDLFLKQVSKWFDLVIFTASVKEYADPVIDLLETERKYFSHRYYRNHCTLREGQGYIKDLTVVDKNLNHIIIIDNSPISYALHEDNAVAVEGWISDSTDTDLLNLIPMLQALRYTTDVRSVLSLKNGEAAFER